MRRFFTDDIADNAKYIDITGSDVNHIAGVLRMNKGEEIVITDGNAYEYTCCIESITDTYVRASVLSKAASCHEPVIYSCIYQCIPKGAKFDYMIQKCVELGVNKIVPVISERTVVSIDNDKDKEKKRQRWQKIAEEACKQSQRGSVPEVTLPIKYKDIFTSERDSVDIIAYENETDKTLKSLISSNMDNIRQKKKIRVIIGSEGGISQNEYSLAVKNGYLAVSLGKRILRTETAALMILSALRYEFED